MNRKIGTSELISSLFLGATFLMVGLGFMVIGLTWLPVIGIFVGFMFFGMSYFMWKNRPSTRSIRIIVGAEGAEALRRTEVNHRRILPVAILSASEGEGTAAEFDARKIDLTSVRFGPNLIEPVDDLSTPFERLEHQRDVNGDGLTDVVLHFPIDETGITSEDINACVVGMTTDGEIIQGCAPIRWAAS